MSAHHRDRSTSDGVATHYSTSRDDGKWVVFGLALVVLGWVVITVMLVMRS